MGNAPGFGGKLSATKVKSCRRHRFHVGTRESLADTDLKDDLVKKFRGLDESGKLQFKDGAQQDIAIPVSFKGFGQAYDAMQKP